MAVFEGQLRVLGETDSGLRAKAAVEGGRLVMTAGTHEIGNWMLDSVAITQRIDGFHMAVEQEELIFTVGDRTSFANAVRTEDRDGGASEPDRRPAGRPARRSVAPARRSVPPARRSVPPAHRSVPPAHPQVGVSRGSRAAAVWRLVPLLYKAIAGSVLVILILGFLVPGITGMTMMVVGGAAIVVGALGVMDPWLTLRIPGLPSVRVLVITGFVTAASGALLLGLVA